ncbi:MAG: S9 family peptidase [Thermoflexales bacterium]|nr:S9 family peptidase [Thermoflexales bacterium]
MPSISPESIFDFVTLEDVRISPDGRYAAFVRVTVDKANNRYKRNIWLKELNGDAPAFPATNGGKDSAPRWRPDGSWLTFLSGREGPPAVYALPMRGGEAQVIATHPNGIQSYVWSPDGTRLAFSAGMRADERAREDAPPPAAEDKPADPKADRFDPRVLTRLPYRTGTTYLEDRFQHLYVVQVPAALGDAPATARRVTDGERSFEAPQWSADGHSLLSATSRDPESGNLFLFIDAVRIPVDGEGRSCDVLTTAGTTYHGAVQSPDGRWIALLARPEENAMFRTYRVVVMPAEGGAPRQLVHAFTGEAGDLRWAADSAAVLAQCESGGATNVFRLGLAGGGAVPVTRGTHEIKAFDVSAEGQVAYIASTETDPAVLYDVAADGTVRALYAPNAALVAEGIGQIEAFRYNSDGFLIDGWLLKPADFDPTRQYPLIVNIHGGPHVMWGAATQSLWIEIQAMAAAGYVVFFCNPRGSGGYGEASQGSIRGAWGDGPMRDVLRGVDLVVARGFIDPRRLCVTGGSYGGYLTAWIISHDRRFAAACAQRGVYNLISFRGTTDIPFFSDAEMGASPWEDIAAVWEQSPLRHALNIETPLLLEHSEQDFRVSIEQAEELFVTLKERRKVVELIRWPREGHELSRAGEPRHRVERIRRIIDWFNRYAPAPERP